MCSILSSVCQCFTVLINADAKLLLSAFVMNIFLNLNVLGLHEHKPFSNYNYYNIIKPQKINSKI